MAEKNHTDEQDGRITPFVRRGDRLHEANDQSFRYRKDLGLPNQVCLFRHEQNNIQMSCRAAGERGPGQAG
jgi:hypothetical protein